MTTPPVSARSPDASAWQSCARLTLDRLPIPFWASALILGGIVLAEQIMERVALASMPSAVTIELVGRQITLAFLTVYMLLALKALKTSSLPRLARLRPAVAIDDDAYARHVKRILFTSPRAELVLFVSSLIVVVAWFLILRLPFPLWSGVSFPARPLQALLVLTAYIVFGWAGLMLVYSTLRFGFELGDLAHEPLKVNVFDPDDLLPFGALSLRQSLIVAVTILLLIVPLGQPTEPEEYAVIVLASLASLSALVIPLWGVHRQMGRARDAAASRISEELARCQARLMEQSELDLPAASDLASRTEKLMALRTAMYKSPSWPFRNASSILRVSLASLSPLIYFILSEVLRTYLLPLLGVAK